MRVLQITQGTVTQYTKATFPIKLLCSIGSDDYASHVCMVSVISIYLCSVFAVMGNSDFSHPARLHNV